MIKFFRQIRQNLLFENKNGKYVKYAVGEILLVVIGILIAIQIDTWNQNRLNRIQENLILTELLNEYSNNLDQLNSKISIRNDIYDSSIKILVYIANDRTNLIADSLNLHLSRILTRPTFDPELGVTNELSSSGKLYLLTNSDLRNRITAFPSLLSEVREEEMVIFNFIENTVFPFLVKEYQIGPIVINFLMDDNFNAKHKLNNSQKNIPTSELFTQIDFNNLLDHPDLEDYLAQLIINTEYTNEQSIAVKLKISEIIDLINKDLKDK